MQYQIAQNWLGTRILRNRHINIYMTKIQTITILVLLAQSLSATSIWYHPDSLVAMQTEDSISYMEEYSVYTVVRSTDTATTSMIWGITENDTLHTGVLTKGIYSYRAGILHSCYQRNFARWCVYAYHSGLRLDSTKQHSLYLGPCIAYHIEDSIIIADSLSAAIEMEEMVFIPGTISRLESAAWQSYLAMKYGITLDYAPYIAPSGDTLWSPTADDNYYHRVVAIGADSTHLWQTTQSASKEHATIQLVATASLQEGQYILLGDDDGEESWSLQADGNSSLVRTWRMKQHYIDSPFSVVWHPTLEIANPDSVVLKFCNQFEIEQYSIRPDSIVGDSAYWFTCPATSETLTLQISTIENEGSDSSTTPYAVYNMSSGTIAFNNLDPDKIYLYALYNNVGQLLSRPSPSRPDAIHVGNLPVGVYRIEAYDHNQIAATAPLVVR